MKLKKNKIQTLESQQGKQVQHSFLFTKDGSRKFWALPESIKMVIGCHSITPLDNRGKEIPAHA